jgi:hypothetical protein
MNVSATGIPVALQNSRSAGERDGIQRAPDHVRRLEQLARRRLGSHGCATR